MAVVTIPKGTIVHIGGLPAELLRDTPMEATPNIMELANSVGESSEDEPLDPDFDSDSH